MSIFVFSLQSIHSEGSQLRVTLVNGNVMNIPLTDSTASAGIINRNLEK